MTTTRIFLLVCTFFTIVSSAQDEASVEKSVFGIHTGLVGVWVNAEFKLASEFALRTEIGAELGTVTSEINDDIAFLLIPVLSVEPRWYYNLDKRARKGKRTAKNSANAFSVNLRYSPNQYFTTSDYNIDIPHQLAIVPSWGIRRVYGKHFTFETAIGVGPVVGFGEDSANVARTQDVFVDLRVRIGYTF